MKNHESSEHENGCKILHLSEPCVQKNDKKNVIRTNLLPAIKRINTTLAISSACRRHIFEGKSNSEECKGKHYSFPSAADRSCQLELTVATGEAYTLFGNGDCNSNAGFPGRSKLPNDQVRSSSFQPQNLQHTHNN